MKTRIEELMLYIDGRLKQLTPLQSNYDEGLHNAFFNMHTSLEQINQNHLTPIEALKASPDWVKALAMDRQGAWSQYDSVDMTFMHNCWVFGGLERLRINFNIEYTGKPEDSLFTRDMIE